MSSPAERNLFGAGCDSFKVHCSLLSQHTFCIVLCFLTCKIAPHRRGPVLHLDFPPMMRAVLDALRPFAVDLESLLQIKCLGELSWYSAWLIRTLGLPALLAAVILLWYWYELRSMKRPEAAERCRGNLFVLVFFLYPGISNRAMDAFNCRTLGPTLAVLQADYSINCMTSEHAAFRLLAGAVVVLFSAGVPVLLMVLMLRRTREYSVLTVADRWVARRIAEELKLDDRLAVDAVADIRMGTQYSFLVSAFQPRFYYFEGELWACPWLCTLLPALLAQ